MIANEELARWTRYNFIHAVGRAFVVGVYILSFGVSTPSKCLETVRSVHFAVQRAGTKHQKKKLKD